MLSVSPMVTGSGYINISGDGMDFSIGIQSGTANIMALGFLVEVGMVSGTWANIRWYQTGTYPSPLDLEYYTSWKSQEALGITGVAFTPGQTYTASREFQTATGINPVNDPSASPSAFAWYPNMYGAGANVFYFMGYTLHCPLSGYYSIYTDKIYVGINSTNPDNIVFNSEITISFAGREITTSASYSGTVSPKMAQHSGLIATRVLLISGAHYTFNFNGTIELISLDDWATYSYPTFYWHIALGDMDASVWYRITGAA